jgi:hypothetical protein
MSRAAEAAHKRELMHLTRSSCGQGFASMANEDVPQARKSVEVPPACDVDQFARFAARPNKRIGHLLAAMLRMKKRSRIAIKPGHA